MSGKWGHIVYIYIYIPSVICDMIEYEIYFHQPVDMILLVQITSNYCILPGVIYMYYMFTNEFQEELLGAYGALLLEGFLFRRKNN